MTTNRIALEEPMSRSLRTVAYIAVGLVAARVLVLAVDAIATGVRRRELYD